MLDELKAEAMPSYKMQAYWVAIRCALQSSDVVGVEMPTAWDAVTLAKWFENVWMNIPLRLSDAWWEALTSAETATTDKAMTPDADPNV